MSGPGSAIAAGPPHEARSTVPPAAPQPNLSAVKVRPAPAEAVLDVRDLLCGYGNSVILHGVGAHLMPRELVTVIGPNGAGKSTLLKASYGLSRVFSGDILVNGRSILAVKPYQLADLGVGFVPQLENVFPTLTVFENLRVGALGRKTRSITADDMERIYSLFPILKVKRAERAGNLSGGQRQMVALARALIARPSILLLDEPSAGLSPKARMDVLLKIKEIKETGIAIMLVEQNAIQSLKIADRGYILAQGRNVFEGTAAQILANEDIGKMFLGRR
jgi:ABC-type branched-subunit amino acid transport system ATPase component